MLDTAWIGGNLPHVPLLLSIPKQYFPPRFFVPMQVCMHILLYFQKK